MGSSAYIVKQSHHLAWIIDPTVERAGCVGEINCREAAVIQQKAVMSRRSGLVAADNLSHFVNSMGSSAERTRKIDLNKRTLAKHEAMTVAILTGIVSHHLAGITDRLHARLAAAWRVNRTESSCWW